MDAIYTSDWADCTAKERKNMYFVMLLSQTDSCISFHGQCKLTIDTFIWVCVLYNYIFYYNL